MYLSAPIAVVGRHGAPEANARFHTLGPLIPNLSGLMMNRVGTGCQKFFELEQ